jgi:hypothetical protein
MMQSLSAATAAPLALEHPAVAGPVEGRSVEHARRTANAFL